MSAYMLYMFVCVFLTEGMQETDSSIRLFVPCLDKRRCFLCCLHDSLGPIVWKQQGFIIGKGIIRVPGLSGGGLGEKGDGNGVEGLCTARWVYCKLGEGCVYVWRGNTKDLGYMWAPPTVPAGLGLTPLSVYPAMTSSLHPVVVHRHSQYPHPRSLRWHDDRISPSGGHNSPEIQYNHLLFWTVKQLGDVIPLCDE